MPAGSARTQAAIVAASRPNDQHESRPSDWSAQLPPGGTPAWPEAGWRCGRGSASYQLGGDHPGRRVTLWLLAITRIGLAAYAGRRLTFDRRAMRRYPAALRVQCGMDADMPDVTLEKTMFKGSLVALITPMRQDGSVDEKGVLRFCRVADRRGHPRHRAGRHHRRVADAEPCRAQAGGRDRDRGCQRPRAGDRRRRIEQHG